MKIKASFSAADLVKQSAFQMKFLREHPNLRTVTPNQLAGTEHQHTVFHYLEGNDKFEEMRTTLAVEDIVICASHDVYDGSKLIEVKSVKGEPKQWYFESSILQTAFYKALFMESDGYIVTSKFYQNEGHERKALEIPLNTPYQLQFGNEAYSVEVTDSEALIKYFYDKAISSLDWTDSKNYDYLHKNKHFNECKQWIKYTKL